MTTHQAVKMVRDVLGDKTNQVYQPTIVRHLKHATQRFARRSSVTVRELEVTLSGAAFLTIDGRRVGPIWRAEFDDASTIRPVYLWPPEKFDRKIRSISTQTAYPVGIARVSHDRLRIAPGGSGTLRLYYSQVPVLDDRNSDRPNGETVVSAGTTTTSIGVSALSHGLVNNNGGATRFFEGCRAVFASDTTTTVLRNQASNITTYSETFALKIVTVATAFSTTPVAGDTFRIEDVLEINESYAEACVNYAAAIIAELDPKTKALSTTLMALFNDSLAEAMGQTYGTERDTPGEFGQPEESDEDMFIEGVPY